MNSDLLVTTLEAAVPLCIAEMAAYPAWERQRIGREAGQVVACQGDVLMFGSEARPGTAARELEHHRGHKHLVNDENRAEYGRKCGICLRGQPSYTAAEVFGWLARGLAAGALHPGGINFAGRHWCAFSHPRCPVRGDIQPPECRCPAGEWRQNGCHQAISGACRAQAARARHRRQPG